MRRAFDTKIAARRGVVLLVGVAVFATAWRLSVRDPATRAAPRRVLQPTPRHESHGVGHENLDRNARAAPQRHRLERRRLEVSSHPGAIQGHPQSGNRATLQERFFGTTNARGSIAASVAISLCFPPKRSTSRAPVGRASTSRSPTTRSRTTSTAASLWSERRIAAPAATPTSATCLTDGPQADRAALLHELGGAALRTGDRIRRPWRYDRNGSSGIAGSVGSPRGRPALPSTRCECGDHRAAVAEQAVRLYRLGLAR